MSLTDSVILPCSSFSTAITKSDLILRSFSFQTCNFGVIVFLCGLQALLKLKIIPKQLMLGSTLFTGKNFYV